MTTPTVPPTIPPGLSGVEAEVARLQLQDDPTLAPPSDSDADFHMQHEASVEEPLSDEDQLLLDEQLAAATQFAVAHPKLKDAEAEGYVSQGFVDGDGVHATRWDLINETFDPARPSMVIYAGVDPESDIVALSYVVVRVGEQPDGFAGPNDRWHQHFGLCVRDGVLAREAFKNPSRCAEIGGRFLSGTTMWMLHAWVVPGQSNRWGMFALSNPDRQSAMPDMPDMDDSGR